jgi:hypothetical protein
VWSHCYGNTGGLSSCWHICKLKCPWWGKVQASLLQMSLSLCLPSVQTLSLPAYIVHIVIFTVESSLWQGCKNSKWLGGMVIYRDNHYLTLSWKSRWSLWTCFSHWDSHFYFSFFFNLWKNKHKECPPEGGLLMDMSESPVGPASMQISGT